MTDVQPTTPEEVSTATPEITPEMYAELEQKLNERDTQAKGYEDFYQKISPILEKLDTNEDLVSLILEGKIDENLVSAIKEGKVDIKTAVAATEAAAEVEQQLKDNNVTTMKDTDIARLIEEKTNEKISELREESELDKFERQTQAFISSTPDFPEYAELIDKWIDENPEVTNVETAYYAVKGRLLTEDPERIKAAEALAAREAASNVSSGNGNRTAQLDGPALVDKLIGSASNPLI